MEPRGCPLAGKTAVSLLVDPRVDLKQIAQDLGVVKMRDLVCRFSSTKVERPVTVPAEVINIVNNASRISCLAPRWPTKGKALISVALNGIDFFSSERMAFVYYSEPLVTSLLPFASDVRGGTVVTISGQDLFDDEMNGARLLYSQLVGRVS